MGTHYNHISLAERIEIDHLRRNGQSCRAIAKAIGRAPSTVVRELRRNSKATKSFEGGYKPERAHRLAARRRTWDGRFKLMRQPALWTRVQKHLAMGWSPQQIAGWLTRNNDPMRISHESIYRFIYHGVGQRKHWHRYLRQRKSRRGYIRRGGPSGVGRIPDRRSISERPGAVQHRCEPGHWEADLMSFSRNTEALLVLVERVSRAIVMTRLRNKTSVYVVRRIADLLRAKPNQLKRSITFDNGLEFAQHARLHQRLGVDTFFCDAYAPWQKGSVENAIGRLRRWLPKGTTLSNVSDADLRKISAAYNHTPRRCHGYHTSRMIF